MRIKDMALLDGQHQAQFQQVQQHTYIDKFYGYDNFHSFYELSLIDRFAYTTKDGVDGWNTVDEAENALLSAGWYWVETSSWQPEVHSIQTDSQGWIYAVNFGFIDDGVPDMSMIHFVRRRKLRRERHFNGKPS